MRLLVSGVVSLGASAAWGGVLLWMCNCWRGEAMPRSSALVCSVVYSPS